MTDARTVRRKATPLGRCPPAGDDPARLVAPLPLLTAITWQPLDALSARRTVLHCPLSGRRSRILPAQSNSAATKSP